MSKILSLTDDEFDIINIAIAKELEAAIRRAERTNELLQDSNLLGYHDMSRSYAKLLQQAQQDVNELQAVADLLDSASYQVSFASEEIPF